MPLVPDGLPSDVRWGFTREGLNSVLHHAHWIPMSRGFARDHMAANWPGLPLNEAISCAKTAGALVKSASHFSGLRVAAGVKEFHILTDGSFRLVAHSRPRRSQHRDRR